MAAGGGWKVRAVETGSSKCHESWATDRRRGVACVLPLLLSRCPPTTDRRLHRPVPNDRRPESATCPLQHAQVGLPGQGAGTFGSPALSSLSATADATH